MISGYFGCMAGTGKISHSFGSWQCDTADFDAQIGCSQEHQLSLSRLWRLRPRRRLSMAKGSQLLNMFPSNCTPARHWVERFSGSYLPASRCFQRLFATLPTLLHLADLRSYTQNHSESHSYTNSIADLSNFINIASGRWLLLLGGILVTGIVLGLPGPVPACASVSLGILQMKSIWIVFLIFVETRFQCLSMVHDLRHPSCITYHTGSYRQVTVLCFLRRTAENS